MGPGPTAGLALAACLALVLTACPPPEPPAVAPPAAPVGGAGDVGLQVLGMVTLEDVAPVAGTPVGGLSALAWDSQEDVWLALSDDRSQHAPARFYTVELELDPELDPDQGERPAGTPSLSAAGVRFTGVTTLRSPTGAPFAAGTVDPEGLALGPGGRLFLSSEGDASQGIPPFVAELRRDGTVERWFEVPDAFLPARDRRTGRPRGVRNNQAFESLTLVPAADGRPRELLVAAEGPLAQDDGAPGPGHGGRARILRFDLDSGRATGQLVYPLDPVPVAPIPADGLAVSGLVELLALDGDTALALERGFVQGHGFFLRLYRASLEGADDVSELDSLPPADAPGAPRLVEKSLLLDLTALDAAGWGLPAGQAPPELFNVEGMALGPALADGRRLLVLVADDNFAADQHTQFLAFAADLERLATAPPPPPLATSIARVQGAAHASPLAGRDVVVEGVVTATAEPGGSVPPGLERGFWIRDPEGDGDPATSEGLFVAVPAALAGGAAVTAGERVRVRGRVLELGRREALTVTALHLDPGLGATAAAVERRGRAAVPPPVELGSGPGAVCPPGHRIDDDGLADFDPATDGLDFWESLEGMAVRVEAPSVVGPTSRYGDLVVVAEGCASAPRTAHGGLRVHPGDFNPERLVVGPRRAGEEAPELAVGQRFAAPLEGVLEYDFANYRLLPAAWPRVEPRPWPLPRTTLGRRADHLTVAALNVENLSAADGEERFAELARTLVEGLGSPDVVALQEVQDDSGAEDDGTVTARRTLERLAAAVVAAGGPRYDFRQVDPVDGGDGGRPGGNIRNALLFDPAGVDFVDRGTPSPTAGVAVVRRDGRPALEPSPGRLAPADPSFRNSRKPLAAELRFHGHTLFVVVNHFRSKGGDDPLMGPFQPPRLPSEEQRSAQARLVAELVESLLAADPAARVVVLGDLNDFEFRPPLGRLTGAGLTNLVLSLPPEQRYTYVYQGNSQVLDHVLVSPALAAVVDGVEAVHRHADLPEAQQPSDHDPLVVRLHLPPVGGGGGGGAGGEGGEGGEGRGGAGRMAP